MTALLANDRKWSRRSAEWTDAVDSLTNEAVKLYVTA